MEWSGSWNWDQELSARLGGTRRWKCLREQKCLLRSQEGREKTPLGHLIRGMENGFFICINKILKLFAQGTYISGERNVIIPVINNFPQEVWFASYRSSQFEPLCSQKRQVSSPGPRGGEMVLTRDSAFL